jgi:hypothetical protein
MLPCPLQEEEHLFPSLVLALRDMRCANKRDPATGDGAGNRSWIGLSIGMIVLDTLSGKSKEVKKRWLRLLRKYDVSEDDAEIVYALRNSLLHGYGPPRREKAGGRKVVLTGDCDGYAIDTTTDGVAFVSVPVFCGCLVERIAAAAPHDWDGSRLDVDFHLDLSRLR